MFFEIRCEPTVEPHKITSTMFFLREYSRNTQISPRERATITGFEKVQVVDLAFLRKFFFRCLYTCTYNLSQNAILATLEDLF